MNPPLSEVNASELIDQLFRTIKASTVSNHFGGLSQTLEIPGSGSKRN